MFFPPVLLYRLSNTLYFQEIYSNPKTFDGFRFEKMRKDRGEDTKHKLASLDLDYLIFGYGRQAWYVNGLYTF